MITPPPDFDPYPGCQGQWVQASDFPGRQSFGYFKCDYCHSGWMSSYAKKGYKQGCKKCERDFMPLYMWKNTQKPEKKNNKTLEDNKKPHRKDLCQACKKGVCTYGLDFGQSRSGLGFGQSRSGLGFESRSGLGFGQSRSGLGFGYSGSRSGYSGSRSGYSGSGHGYSGSGHGQSRSGQSGSGSGSGHGYSGSGHGQSRSGQSGSGSGSVSRQSGQSGQSGSSWGIFGWLIQKIFKKTV